MSLWSLLPFLMETRTVGKCFCCNLWELKRYFYWTKNRLSLSTIRWRLLGWLQEEYKYIFLPCISLLIFLICPSCLLSFLLTIRVSSAACIDPSFLPSFLPLISSVSVTLSAVRNICLTSTLFVFAGTLPWMIFVVPQWDHRQLLNVQKTSTHVHWCGLTLGVFPLPNVLDYWAGAGAKTSSSGSNTERVLPRGGDEIRALPNKQYRLKASCQWGQDHDYYVIQSVEDRLGGAWVGRLYFAIKKV